MRKPFSGIVLVAIMALLLASCTITDSRRSSSDDSVTASSDQEESESKDQTSSDFSLDDYNGTWVSRDYQETTDGNGDTYISGSVVELNVSDNSEDNTIEITCSSIPPQNLTAQISSPLDFTDKSTAEFSFEDDGWGNRGTGTIKFNKGAVVIDISLDGSPDSNWSMFDGKKTFTAVTSDEDEDSAISEDTSDSGDSSEEAVTEGSDAVDPSAADVIMQDYFNDLPENYYVDFDHEETVNGTVFYVYHGYEVVLDNETGDSHTATWGWYYVDTATETIYEWDLATMILNPINNDDAESIQMSE